jgi:negative regulator of flagellin synthesis FlgM
MNVRNVPPYVTDAVQNSGAATAKPGTQEKVGAATGVSSDRVELSKNYQDLAQAQKSIARSDEVRADKVQQIKNQLQSGTYEIKPGAIAGKMLDEVI